MKIIERIAYYLRHSCQEQQCHYFCLFCRYYEQCRYDTEDEKEY